VRDEIRLARQEGKTFLPIKGPGLGDLNALPRWIGQLTDIDIPKLPDNFRGSYLRFCPGEWPMVTVALLTRWADGACAEARLGLGCVGPRPIRVGEFEQALRGKSGDELAAKADKLAGIAAQSSDPLADLWGSVEYKRQIVKNLVRDGLRSQCDGRG